VPRTSSELTQRESYQTALLGCAVTVLVELAGMLVDHRFYRSWLLVAFDLAHAVQAAILGVVLWRFGRSWSVRTCDWLIVALALPFLVTTWVPQHAVIEHGRLVEPFLAHNFLLLGLAFLAPSSLRLTLGLIALTVLQGIAMWLPVRAVAQLPWREPFFTLLFATIAVALVASRHRQRRLGAQLASAASRADDLARRTALVLAFRDQANSPLQTLEIGLSTLEHRLPEQSTILRSLRAALQRLTNIHRTLGSVDIKTRADDALTPDLEGELSKLRHPGGDNGNGTRRRR